VSQCS